MPSAHPSTPERCRRLGESRTGLARSARDISPHQRAPGLNDFSLGWCCAEKHGEANNKVLHQRMAQSLDPLCTGKDGYFSPELDAVVLPALSGRAINVVLLMKASVLVWCQRLVWASTTGLKRAGVLVQRSQQQPQALRRHYPWRSRFCRSVSWLDRVVGSLPNTCTITGLVSAWLLLVGSWNSSGEKQVNPSKRCARATFQHN